jgi:hypothetical protein
MAYAFVVSASGQSTDQQVVTTSGVDTSAANFIVIGSHFSDTFGSNNVPTDSNSNTWTLAVANYSGDAFGMCIEVYYCVNPTVGGGHTFSITSSGNFNRPSLSVLAFSGGGSSTVDIANGSHWSSFPTNTFTGSNGSRTPAGDNALVCSFFTTSNSDSPPATTTDLAVQGPYGANNGNALGFGVDYTIQTTASAVTVTWSEQWVNGDRNTVGFLAFSPGSTPTGKRFFLIPN